MMTMVLIICLAAGTGDVWYEAAAGSGPGGARLLRTARDWFSVLGGWVAADPESAAQGCAEMVRSLQEINLGPMVPTGPGSTPPDPRYLPGAEWEELRPRLTPPTARRVDGGAWIARVWIIQPRQPRGAVLYECRLPTSPDAADPGYAAVDSIVIGPDMP